MIECKNITKNFGNTKALDNVTVKFKTGKITALLGENGAGKTTLMNIIYGMFPTDSGSMSIREKDYLPESPLQAITCGISMIHQTQALIENFTVLENIILGFEPAGFGPVIDLSSAREKIARISGQLGLSIDPDSKVSTLDPFTRQGVEIARALFHEGDFIILDEPTTLLAPAQVEKLFSILIQIRNEGKGVILVTHKLSEVENYVDEIAILRGGRLVLNKEKDKTAREELIKAIIGTERKTKEGVKKKTPESGKIPEKYLNIDDVTLPPLAEGSGLNGFSLESHMGEIIGITGVPGNGQTEILELLSGLRKSSSGDIYIDGIKYSQGSLADMRRSESAFIFPEKDREGLSIDSSLADNMLLSKKWLKENSYLGLIEDQKLSNATEEAIHRFNIKSGGSNHPVNSLSGGNRQKVVLAREIEGDVKLLVAAEPVRGLDIQSSDEIAGYFRELRDRGCAIIIISGDMEFLMPLCDRIAVIYKGRIGYQENRDNIDKEKFGKAMLGYN